MPFTDAITLQPAVVPVVGIGVIKSPSYPCCQWIGVDIPKCIQHPSVVFRSNRSSVIPCLPEVPATPSKAKVWLELRIPEKEELLIKSYLLCLLSTALTLKQLRATLVNPRSYLALQSRTLDFPFGGSILTNE